MEKLSFKLKNKQLDNMSIKFVPHLVYYEKRKYYVEAKWLIAILSIFQRLQNQNKRQDSYYEITSVKQKFHVFG